MLAVSLMSFLVSSVFTRLYELAEGTSENLSRPFYLSLAADVKLSPAIILEE